MAQIEIDTSGIEKLADKMAKVPDVTLKAAAYAVNRTISRAITFTAEEVRKEYPSIKRKDIKAGATIKKATANYLNMNASITFKGTRLRASMFPHTISRTKNRSPVTLKIKSTAKTSKPSPVMFGEGSGGNRGARGTREVYKRINGQNAIKPVYTISIPQMISNDDVYKRISERVSDEFLKTFEHELDYRLGYLD